jgi:hypothetical protein
MFLSLQQAVRTINSRKSFMRGLSHAEEARPSRVLHACIREFPTLPHLGTRELSATLAS